MKKKDDNPAWRIACFGCTRQVCQLPAFWALLAGQDPPTLTCPACGGPAVFRGWANGLADVVHHLAPLLPGKGQAG